MTGLSALIGSWNTIERCAPRIRWSSCADSVSRLRSPYPARCTLPVERAGGDGISPAIVRHVTLLPQPLSPTSPRISRSPTVNDTPSTARTTPASVAMYVRRSSTSSTGAAGVSHRA